MQFSSLQQYPQLGEKYIILPHDNYSVGTRLNKGHKSRNALRLYSKKKGKIHTTNHRTLKQDFLMSVGDMTQEPLRTPSFLTGRHYVKEGVYRYFAKVVAIPISPSPD